MRPPAACAASAPPSSCTSSAPRSWQPRMPELALPDATLAYEQSGEGPDIVWLAAGDNPGDNWRRYQTPAFEPGYRNTTYDARGVGATRSDTPPPWDIEAHARDLA